MTTPESHPPQWAKQVATQFLQAHPEIQPFGSLVNELAKVVMEHAPADPTPSSTFTNAWSVYIDGRWFMSANKADAEWLKDKHTPSPDKLAALAETPTPRTDNAEAEYLRYQGKRNSVHSPFARQLERELTHLKAEQERANHLLVRAKAWLLPQAAGLSAQIGQHLNPKKTP